MRDEAAVLKLFNEWANKNNSVRTAIMTSSRTRDNADIDFLSDYDIELYVSSYDGFMTDDWLSTFGTIMVRWPYKAKSTGDDNWITRLILFDEGLRIDFQITTLSEVVESRYINGYEVLVDKDGKTTNMKDATYDEFIIHKPSKDEFEALVNEYWWDVYYVPKYLWRKELPFAKFMLDNIMRYEYLHKLIDWYIGYNNNWTVETGALGKKYEKLLSAKDWKEFEASYTGGGINNNWEGLIKATSLFRRIATELSEALAYEYPVEVDRKVMKFCYDIMSHPKN